MDQQGVELLGDIQAQDQPGQGLKGQKYGAQRGEQNPVPPAFAAAGDGHAQRRAEEEHQPKINPAENIEKTHIRSRPLVPAASCLSVRKGSRTILILPQKAAAGKPLLLHFGMKILHLVPPARPGPQDIV